jgi:hypothetical protein
LVGDGTASSEPVSASSPPLGKDFHMYSAEIAVYGKENALVWKATASGDPTVVGDSFRTISEARAWLDKQFPRALLQYGVTESHFIDQHIWDSKLERARRHPIERTIP